MTAAASSTAGARARRRVAEATVVVLTGGTSSEREVALESGRCVARALAEAPADDRGPARVATVEIEADGRWRVDGVARAPAAALAALPADALVFLALHGGEGEDGTVQGFLEHAGVTYTGSGVGASALCMDKAAARCLLADAGLTVAPGACLDARAWAGDRDGWLTRCEGIAAASPRERAYVKPNAGGSSVDTFRVGSRAELADALDAVLATGDRALVEADVSGTEATCAVLGNAGDELVALPPVEIVPHAGRFFDYEEKYRATGAAEHCPPRSLPASVCERLAELARTAHRATGCDGYSRTDFIVPGEPGAEPVALEINTLPGLTERSLFPQSMHAAGHGYRELCLRLLELAVERRERAP